jgi:hypothetical protein
MIKTKAYKEEWINNKYILQQMASWKDLGLISSETLEIAIEKLKVGFKQYNIFAKIGLFIFSWIALSSAGGISALIVFQIIGESKILLQTLTIISSLLLFVLLEILIKNGNFYRSGPDNLVFYAATSMLIVGIYQVFGFEIAAVNYFFIATLVLSLTTIRYADPLLSLSLFVVFVGFVFAIVTKSDFGKVIIPFVLMLVAGVSYFLNDKWVNSIYYEATHKVFKACSMVLFYLGGNYYIVREGNAMLASLSQSVEIPFSWIFWFFTLSIPILYLLFGLRTKDRQILHLGILAVIASLFTFRNYYQILPLEYAMSLIGLILIVSTIFLNRWLKSARKGITSLSSKENPNFEAVLVSEIIQSKLGSKNEGVKFGGGSFGGGGAGSEF